jgi:hypothetical protein
MANPFDTLENLAKTFATKNNQGIYELNITLAEQNAWG